MDQTEHSKAPKVCKEQNAVPQPCCTQTPTGPKQKVLCSPALCFGEPYHGGTHPSVPARGHRAHGTFVCFHCNLEILGTEGWRSKRTPPTATHPSTTWPESTSTAPPIHTRGILGNCSRGGFERDHSEKGALQQPPEAQIEQKNPMEVGRAHRWHNPGAPQRTTRSPTPSPGALRAAGWG